MPISSSELRYLFYLTINLDMGPPRVGWPGGGGGWGGWVGLVCAPRVDSESMVSTQKEIRYGWEKQHVLFIGYSSGPERLERQLIQ